MVFKGNGRRYLYAESGRIPEAGKAACTGRHSTNAMGELAEKYVNVSNLLLKCDYYAEEEKKDSD